jgi:hypothetical protein
MSFFNKINLTFLNFAQKVVTITTGTNIGINNILQIIEANFDDIKRMFNPAQAGGGIRGENLVNNTVTSDKVSLTTNRFIQIGGAVLQVNQGGNTGFAPNVTLCNGTITIGGTTNKDILVNSKMTDTVINNGTGNLVTLRHLFQISSNAGFTSILGSRLITEQLLPSGNSIWTVQNTYINETFNLAVGTYFVRLIAGLDGNAPASMNVYESYLCITQL